MPIAYMMQANALNCERQRAMSPKIHFMVHFTDVKMQKLHLNHRLSKIHLRLAMRSRADHTKIS